MNLSSPYNYINTSITLLKYNGYTDGICSYAGVSFYQREAFSPNKGPIESLVLCGNFDHIFYSSFVRNHLSHFSNIVIVIYLFPQSGKATDIITLNVHLTFSNTHCQGFTFDIFIKPPIALRLSSATITISKRNKDIESNFLEIDVYPNKCIGFQLGNVQKVSNIYPTIGPIELDLNLETNRVDIEFPSPELYIGVLKRWSLHVPRRETTYFIRNRATIDTVVNNNRMTDYTVRHVPVEIQESPPTGMNTLYKISQSVFLIDSGRFNIQAKTDNIQPFSSFTRGSSLHLWRRCDC